MTKAFQMFTMLLLAHATLAAQSLELLLKIDKGLPASGRNGSQLGEVVSYVGDVNNDGYDDWAIGLPGAALYETGERMGKIYIYFGSNDIPDNQNPNLILIGEVEGDRFGESVVFAGDVNHDGYSDVLTTSDQRAAIYYGGSPMDSNADVILDKEDESSFFGVSVSGAGDVNNDSYDEVVIGSKDHVYIYLGSSSMDSNADVVLTGESERDEFGFCVSDAGDVNRDGFDDVIIGAQGYYAGGYDAGRAYVYYGSAHMDSIADVVFSAEAAGDWFGEVVFGAGDLNHDGCADVLVKALRRSGGRNYIFWGGDPMDANPDLIISGNWIYPASDINGDDFDDLLLGTDEGILIFLGSSQMDNIADVNLALGAAGGFGMAGKGDCNHDGFADVIIGKPYDDTNGQDAGRVSLYYGGEQIDADADALFYGEPAMEYFGTSVSYAGDFNHDGYDDVIVGAPGDGGGGAEAGCADLYFGGEPLDANADLIFRGYTDYGHWGRSVSYAGDVNADGFSDVIVGGFNTGRARVYFGTDATHTITSIALSSGKTGDNLGVCVASAGDLNQDGYADVIVGASSDNSNGTQAGRAYLYFGGRTMDPFPDLILSGEAEFNRFGDTVCPAGDVNNDGYADVMAAAPGNEAGGDMAGRVYVFHGSPLMDSQADVIMTGKPHQWFGSNMAGVGDINRDGFDDIAVAVPYIAAAPGGVSYVYLYYGGVRMDANPEVVIEGGFGFGIAVAYAGDLNDDDYADLMVGDGSRVFFYYGGAEMDTIPDIVLTSEARSSEFGSSLSYAGDVNKDGHPDLLIGAPYHAAVGQNMGRAYLYSWTATSSVSSSAGNAEKEYKLYHNYPNPFNPSTTIVYALPKQSNVELKVYTIMGQEIVTLVNEPKPAGSHSVQWNGRNELGEPVPAGLYLYRMRCDEFVRVRKMVLIE